MKNVTKFLKDNQHYLIIAILGLFLLYLYSDQLAEGFTTCNIQKKVVLNDVSGGLSEGAAMFEQNRGRLYVSIQGNIPYNKGGTFNTVVSDYKVYLVKEDDKGEETSDRVYLGYMIRYGDRVYRLKNELLGTYSDYTHVLVERIYKNKAYAPEAVLKGKLQ